VENRRRMERNEERSEKERTGDLISSPNEN
jgi:hypothetical protein